MSAPATKAERLKAAMAVMDEARRAWRAADRARDEAALTVYDTERLIADILAEPDP